MVSLVTVVGCSLVAVTSYPQLYGAPQINAEGWSLLLVYI